jgi:hypothetical protein
VERVVVRAVFAQVLVVAGMVGLIAGNVLMTRATVHDAFPGGAHHCAPDGSDNGTHRSAGHCADHSAGDRASNG